MCSGDPRTDTVDCMVFYKNAAEAAKLAMARHDTTRGGLATMVLTKGVHMRYVQAFALPRARTPRGTFGTVGGSRHGELPRHSTNIQSLNELTSRIAA